MNLLQAINKRVSRRTYEQSPIDPIKKQLLLDEIIKINFEQKLNITWIDDGSDAFNSFVKSYGLFTNVQTIIALSGKSNDPNLLEKIGYYGEMLVLQATLLDLGTCWVGGTFDNSSPIFNVKEDEELIIVITIGNVKIEKNMKEKLVAKMSHLNTKKLDSFYISDQKPPSWFIDGIRAVQKAPSALNNQPVMFEYDYGIVRVKVDEKYPRQMIDLGIAKLHFELAANTKLPLGNKITIDYEKK